ncbi:MFS general substrate transporter [Russula earlei]|uniref:MFS general substrate transporter n=1 Tax=Russula earlei TaxID=71964 RepID=A0ACC0TTK7_9AGAM|nr:MFS general substrate transporter [Russula earlei]
MSPSSLSTVRTSPFDKYEFKLEPGDDACQLSLFRRWLAVATICGTAFCVACASSIAAFTVEAVSRQFHVGKEVATLGISLYALGLGTGPLFTGPLSEVYGGNIVYRVSLVLFFAFNSPIPFSPHIGFCGATSLTVAGGSVGDMFSNMTIGTPMAVFTITQFLGPEFGPLLSGFINQNMIWRCTYYFLIIWSFMQAVALICFVPEIYVPVILKWKAQHLREITGDWKYYAPLEKENVNLGHAILVSCYRPFQLILCDRMALLIDVWNAFLLGVQYLAFEVDPFFLQTTGLTFLAIAIGFLVGFATTPYWNERYRRFVERNGDPPPEFRLRMGQVGGALVSLSLFWLAFTTYEHGHWITIIASVPFGTCTYFVFASSFTYLLVAYRPIAASAMASNIAMRATFASVFPLFATRMNHTLGTVRATSLLACVATAMAPLPFVFYRIGARLREKSKFAA